MFKLLIPLIALSSGTLAGDDKAIREINSKNALIKSFTADVQIIIARRAARFTSYGKLSYEKDKKFRLVTHAAVENKFMSDIGSNSSYFWVYARRLNPDYAIYSSYANLSKTNLKASLEPAWMMDCFCVEQIPTHKTKVEMQGDKLVVLQARASPRQNTVFRAITIDPTKPAIVGNYLYNQEKKLLAYATVSDHYSTNNKMYVPKTIQIGSSGEDAVLYWEFSNYKFNVPIDADTFKMPNLSVQKIDLASGVTVKGIND